MDITSFIVFVILLATPTIYQRTKFKLSYKSFLKTELREKTGLQIHHGHWGIIFIFISSMALLFFEKNIFSTSFMGLGLGLLLDEVIPSLMMPSKDRVFELEVYKKAQKSTILLIVGVFGLSLILFLISIYQ
jgi:hypothetical protein